MIASLLDRKQHPVANREWKCFLPFWSFSRGCWEIIPRLLGNQFRSDLALNELQRQTGRPTEISAGVRRQTEISACLRALAEISAGLQALMCTSCLDPYLWLSLGLDFRTGVAKCPPQLSKRIEWFFERISLQTPGIEPGSPGWKSSV